MKARYLIAAAAAAFAIGSAADAAIFVSVTVDGTQVATPAVAQDAGTGDTGSLNYTSGNVNIRLSAQGKGTGVTALNDPGFLAQTLSILSNDTTTHNIVIMLSQTGLTSTTLGFMTTNSINALLAATGSTATAQAFLGQSNNAYDMTTALTPLLNCTAGMSCDTGSPVYTASAHPSPFSETVRYTVSLAGSGRIQANSQIGAMVPEPATWGLMVLGFGAIGGALRTSRRKVVFA